MLDYKNQNIILFGYSGHAYVVIDALQSCGISINAYYDLNENSKNPYHLKYLGSEQNVDLSIHSGDNYVFPAIGSNQVRKKLLEQFESYRLKQATVIHQKSIVSDKVKIGSSTLIAAGAVINPFVEVGKANIINTASIIEHECIIGNYCHIAPGAVLAGNVTLGDEVFIGANSVVKQGVKIGDRVIVGAGSVVINDIQEGTWVGNPAKKIK